MREPDVPGRTRSARSAGRRPAARGPRSPRSRPGPPRRALPALAVVLLVIPGAGCTDPGRAAVERGDRLAASGELEPAIAEYKLARRQSGETPEVLLRLAHVNAERGDVDEALRHYRTLLARDSSHRYQAAADLAAAARRALEGGDREGMARALQPLVEIDLGLVPRDLRLALARHRWREGEFADALPLYLTVLADSAAPGTDGEIAGSRSDSTTAGGTASGTGGGSAPVPPAVRYETARAYEELGGCRQALEHFARYMEETDRSAPERDGARWHYGRCLFEAASEDRERGHPRAALDKLDGMIALGAPQTLLEQAHFLRGELYLALGDPETALAAYERVLTLNPSRTGILVRRAEERIRDIRYGYPR